MLASVAQPWKSSQYGSIAAQLAQVASARSELVGGEVNWPTKCSVAADAHSVFAEMHRTSPVPASGTGLVKECVQCAPATRLLARPHLVSTEAAVSWRSASTK